MDDIASSTSEEKNGKTGLETEGFLATFNAVEKTFETPIPRLATVGIIGIPSFPIVYRLEFAILYVQLRPSCLNR